MLYGKNHTRKPKKPGRAAIFALLLAACAVLVCGCAGEDKYVEIIIAAGDTVVTPVPAVKAGSAAGAQAAASMEPVGDSEEKMQAGPEQPEKETPQETSAPTPTPTPVPTLTPTPIPTLLPTPTLRPTPTQGPTPTPLATVPAPTAAPTANTDALMQQQLNDLTLEYNEEREKLRGEYEGQMASIRDSIKFMGPPVDDPEYIQYRAELEARLAALETELGEKERTLDAAYGEKRSAIYEKYGVQPQ